MECPICAQQKCQKIAKNYPGYIESTTYTIYHCTKCGTQFIDSVTVDPNIYDLIYSTSDISGYDRYYNYATEIKSYKNPLQFLAQEEANYAPVAEFVKHKSNLKILDIGCGYGYLTYALNYAGHTATGIDISKNVIEIARMLFGKNYVVSSVEDFKPKSHFDLIVATELIEHLSDPILFVQNCVRLLKDTGSLLVTAPNKDFHPSKSIWRTDLPPVHTMWLGKESLKFLANEAGVAVEIQDPTNFTTKNNNKLLIYAQSRINITPTYAFAKTGTKNSAIKVFDKSIPLKIAKSIAYQPFVKKVSNLIADLIITEDSMLVAKFYRK